MHFIPHRILIDHGAKGPPSQSLVGLATFSARDQQWRHPRASSFVPRFNSVTREQGFHQTASPNAARIGKFASAVRPEGRVYGQNSSKKSGVTKAMSTSSMSEVEVVEGAGRERVLGVEAGPRLDRGHCHPRVCIGTCIERQEQIWRLATPSSDLLFHNSPSLAALPTTIMSSSTLVLNTTPPPSSPTFASPSEERIVRFDDACILIPDPPPRSRMSRFILPLWKKRPRADSATSEPEADPSKASRPSKRPLSPQHTTADTAHPKPLHSCLVNHSTPNVSAPRGLTRQSSSPRPDVITVPLRPCCVDCFNATERCILEGDNWTEKFTRAARRRRSASVDYCAHGHVAPRVHNMTASPTASPGSPPFATVTIDEVACKTGVEDLPAVFVEDEGAESPQSDTTLKDEEPALLEPQDMLLPRLLATRRHDLSPIPSRNASTVDLSISIADRQAADADADAHPHAENSPPPSPSCSPSPVSVSSSLPRTPPPIFAPNARVRTSSSPTSPGLSASPPGSPRMKAHFHIPSVHMPSGAALMRAGSDMLKSVNVISGSPV